MIKIRWPILRRREAEPPSRIIVGLGNPGSQYARSRHNVGFWCVDRVAVQNSIELSRRHRSTLIGEGFIEGHRAVLAKPRTFVNRSGQAVTYLLTRYGVSRDELLIIHDDMDLPLGRIRLRPSGSAGGHNGIKSVIEEAGTQDFARLRIGIGRPPLGSDEVEYVLGAMSEDEMAAMDDIVERAAQSVACLIAEGITAAMNRFN